MPLIIESSYTFEGNKEKYEQKCKELAKKCGYHGVYLDQPCTVGINPCPFGFPKRKDSNCIGKFNRCTSIEPINRWKEIITFIEK